ncbi:hypothetical protein SLS58_003288 [Diplodia intermedia]|uniref:Alpha/beta hydrolase fold-3 domain-containing protein n=1 Tax=Diplodia intermedia TaxID=856260 RepID=A0ABR3TXE2_9PEZI
MYIPNRHGNPLRTLIFRPPSRNLQTNQSRTGLSPLHVSIHAGGFMGGIPEYNAAFASLLSSRTGAVVVLPSYRFAPLHSFPAAIDDIDDVVAWLQSNSAQRLGADPSLLTISGFSAGANLALGATQQQSDHRSDSITTDIKASVTFYAPVDLRLPPHEKPVPAGLPETNPIGAILPLSDAYVASGAVSRERNMADARLHPILAELRTLPERMLFVIPTLDILLHEQLVLVERLKREIGEGGEGRFVESLIVEGQWHGWVELPDFMIDTKTKYEAFDTATEFIRETHRRHGWEWTA